MKRTLISAIVTLSGLALLASSCSEVAITGRKQFNLVPDALMNNMSFQSYSEFLAQNKRSTDTAKTKMVKDVGLKIQRGVEQYCIENNMSDQLSGYQWEFNLIEDSNVNAWCMSGGKVVVYTGILPLTKNEAGLAVVTGHEIAHAFAKHGADRMSQGLLVNFGGMAISKAMETQPEQTKNLFMLSYGVGTQVGVLLPYSRLHESEADHLGLIFMAMAGYDPHESVTFWQRMA